MPARRTARVLLVVAMVSLAACSSAGSATHAAPTTSSVSAKPSAATESCTWFTLDQVRRVIGTNVEAGRSDQTIDPLCTYTYTSKTGVSTDLVVGSWNSALNGSIDDFQLPGRTRHDITGLGDQAVFLKTRTIDDGNSVLVVVSGKHSLLLGGEFLSLDQAKQLARLMLARWATTP